MPNTSNEKAKLWTVGHSTRSLEEFLDILRTAEIAVVADVRRFPGSRKFPQFGSDSLAASLREAGVGYQHFPDLGGRRKSRSDSPNTAWRNESFRAYADYMETDEFSEGIERLLELARRERVAVMCSEAVWWRCHRGLIADYLKVRGHEVIHLLSPAKHDEHPYTSAARVVYGRLDYSPGQDRPTLD